MLTGASPRLAGLILNQEVCLVDENVETIYSESLTRFDIVGVSGMIVQKRRMLEILRTLHRAGIFTVVGGAYASVDEGFFDGHYDVIFSGEADETWPEFVECFAAGKPIKCHYRQPRPTDMPNYPS